MAIHTVYTLSKDDPEARNWLAFFRRHGHSALLNLVIERVYWLEGAINVEKLLPLLTNPLYQTSSPLTHLDPTHGPIVEIGYRPAVTDPETPSILAGARALGEVGLEFARLSKRYQFVGLEKRKRGGLRLASCTTKSSSASASRTRSFPRCGLRASLTR